MNVKMHLDLLGRRATDKVTGFSGVVTSVHFDLYGCIQALVNPGADETGKLKDQCYFDVSRLIISDAAPVMERPNFEYGDIAEGRHGPAEKPLPMKS